MKRGFTLIEIIIVIALVAVLMSILASSLGSVPLARESALRVRAHALLEEELARLKTLSFEQLTNRAEARFAGVLYNRGKWQVQTDAPQSAPHVLSEIMPAKLVTSNVTGAIKLPVDTAADFTLQTVIRIDNTSPTGWQAGLFFRARDLENQYRVILRSNRLRIEKLVNGAVIELSSNPVTIDLERWYTLEVRAIAGAIEARLNGVLIAQITDNTFTSGYLGWLSLFGALIAVDDISLTDGRSLSWNFDADAVGSLPNSWRDFGVYELPQGTDFLTISDYAGIASIKQIIARIDWQENEATSTARLETLISN